MSINVLCARILLCGTRHRQESRDHAFRIVEKLAGVLGFGKLAMFAIGFARGGCFGKEGGSAPEI